MEMKVALFSNVNLDMVSGFLPKGLEVFESEGYGQWVSYAMAPNDRLIGFHPEACFLLIDGGALVEHCHSLEQGRRETLQAVGYVGKFAEVYPECKIVVSTIDIPRRRIFAAVDLGWEATWESEWVGSIANLAQSKSNVVPFDLKNVIAREGRGTFYSSKMWYTGSIPYSMKGIKVLSEEIANFCRKLTLKRKKMLVLDMDNTLWGGVIGEDGAEGIVLGESLLGAAYRDAQKRIKELADMGVLLAIASKNNPEDADSAFENTHMVLKREDFVCVKTNWNAKGENVAEMATDLNLGVDSFVFLDDNGVEREQMSILQPAVAVADFPKNVANLPATIEAVYDEFFWIERLTKEDESKTRQYHQEAKRAEVRSSSASMEDYLLSLEMDVVVQEANDKQLPRVVQLLNKTNQFNTNTVRMTDQEMFDYLSDGANRVFVASVSDRYGDSGLVVVLLVRCEDGIARIENFIMSCRVMGRQIENTVISAICDKVAELGAERVEASFVRSKKNKPVEDLYDKLGFDLLESSEEHKSYVVSLPYGKEPLVKARWEQ